MTDNWFDDLTPQRSEAESGASSLQAGDVFPDDRIDDLKSGNFVPRPVAAAGRASSSQAGDVSFDDLIQKYSKPAPQAAGNVSFDDLIQKYAKQPGDQTVANPFAGAMPSPLEATKQGFVSGLQEFQQTGQALSGQAPTAEKESPAAAPFEWSWYPHESGVSKLAYRLAKSSPTMAGGILGGVAGSAVEPGLGTIAGGALGAGVADAAQTLGPFYRKRLNETPNDPDGAFNSAMEDASISGAFSGAGWAAFPLKAFSGPIKNILFQAFGVQPGIGMTQQALTNAREGQPLSSGLGQAYVEGAIGTAVPMGGHAILAGGLGALRGRGAPEEAAQQPASAAPAEQQPAPQTEERYPNAPESLRALNRGRPTPDFLTPKEQETPPEAPAEAPGQAEAQPASAVAPEAPPAAPAQPEAVLEKAAGTLEAAAGAEPAQPAPQAETPATAQPLAPEMPAKPGFVRFYGGYDTVSGKERWITSDPELARSMTEGADEAGYTVLSVDVPREKAEKVAARAMADAWVRANSHTPSPSPAATQPGVMGDFGRAQTVMGNKPVPERLRKAVNNLLPEAEKPQLEPTPEAPGAEPLPAEAQPMPQETSAKQPVTGFTTAKGSTYQVHEDGTTTRDKSDHSAVGHDTSDVGLKPRSAKTVYIDDAGMASALSAAGITAPEGTQWRVLLKDGKATLVSRQGDGPWGASPSSRNIPFSTEPGVGKAPLELWKPKKDVFEYEAYSGMHAGNAIVSMERPAAIELRRKELGKPSLAVDDVSRLRDEAEQIAKQKPELPTPAAEKAWDEFEKSLDQHNEGQEPVKQEPHVEPIAKPLPEHPAEIEAEAVKRAADPEPNPEEQVQKDIEATAPAVTVEKPEPVDAYAGKWFGSKEKADAFIAKKGIGATHEVVGSGKRFEIKPRAEEKPAEPKPEAPAPAGKPDNDAIARAGVRWADELSRAGREDLAKKAGFKDAWRISKVLWRHLKAEEQERLASAMGEEKPVEAAAPEAESTPETPKTAANPHEAFISAVSAKLAAGEKPFKTIVEARKLAREHGLTFPEGEPVNKHIDELVERAVVKTARDVAAAGAAPDETFARMIKLYEDQPNLSTRTSASVAEQAYSTPAPLAYVASRLAGVDRNTRVLEPTAGNGMLLMEADPAKARVNELNGTRAKSLKAQGFKTTTKDAANEATFADNAGQMDTVIANPPFGAVRIGGESKVFSVGDYKTTQIDHAIALNALRAMKEDGRAVLIIGGVDADTPQARAEGYGQKAKRRFFHQLLNNYKVADIFTVAGDLYAKQGAGWPVDVIVIDGKGKTDLTPLTKEAPPLLKSWDEVGAKLNEAPARSDTGTAVDLGQDSESSRATVEGERQPASRDEVGGEPSSGRGDVQRESEPQEPAGMGGGSARPELGHEGPERPVDQGARGAPGKGGDVRKPDLEPDTEGKRAVAEAKEGQTPYEPASQQGVKLNTLSPANLRDATEHSLARLQREHGNIDHYVADALGRTPQELGKYFSAEQVDAIGLGVSNIQKGEGFIIGDQTGLGKGRVVAAMITYARRNNLVPVFVTEKPGLYGDMWRDLHDIGWDKQLGRPVEMMMTNANTRVPLDDAALEWMIEADEAKAEGREPPPQRGKFSAPQSTAKATSNMQALLNGKIAPDVVFTTYDQMNSVKGSETDRRRFLQAIAPHAFLIMDEAHNAGGSGAGDESWRAKDKAPPRSEVFRDAVAKARSVMYSSATYAKSPSVMTLYSKTDMAKAVEDPRQLPNLIARGGVPLQQVVASMLAKAGQYMRRERSFEGVTYDHENVPVSADAYGEFTNGLRSVFDFDRAFEKERQELAGKAAAERFGGRAKDFGVGEAAASSTSFSSIMHNVINQMIMALKAEKAGERAVEALKAGEKPVIALSKTNASFIEDYTKSAGLTVGDTANISFADILRRYLERTRRVTLKLGNDEKVHYTIPLSDMSPSMQSMYRHAGDMLRDIDIGDLPVSPIDAIRHAVQKAGYSVREVTGRGEMLDYSGGEPVIVKRPASEIGEPGKKVTVKQFNDGGVDAVILNRSGSTGISMHASSKFQDQRRRRMIIAEADPNIDTHMQMLGRVHRTGQVIPPAYTHLAADIPAEVRPTAVLMRKMASLNANTTGAAKSRFSSESVDFLNKYGDQVVQSVMQAEPETWLRLGTPIDLQGEPAGAAAKVTGRLTLLPPEEQQALLDRITSEYKSLIETLDATGTNDLEAKHLDLQARTLETKQLKAETGSSPFQSAVNLDKVSIKSQGRSFAPNEVAQRVAEALKIKEGGHDFAQNMPAFENIGRAKQDKLISDIAKKADDHLRGAKAALRDPDAKQRLAAKSNEDFNRFRELASITHPGATITLDLNGEKMPAVVIGFEQKKGAKNPIALSSWQALFAMPDSSRSLGVPLSRLLLSSDKPEEGKIGVSRGSSVSPVKLADMFDQARKEGRENRYMVTGNILGGFDQTEGSGQIITHTMEDGSARPAILMNKQFKPKEFFENRAVRFENGEHVLKFLEATKDGEVKSADNIISIRPEDGRYAFEMPAAKATGGKYYADRTVRDVYDNWERRSGKMRASLPADQAAKLIDALRGVGAVFETRSDQDLANSSKPSTPDTTSQYAIGAPSYAEDFRARAPEVAKAIEDQIRSWLPKDVAVRVADSLQADLNGKTRDIEGRTDATKGLIEVAMKYGPEHALSVGRHEVVHYLKEMGFYRPQEWKLLVDQARKEGSLEGRTVADENGKQAPAEDVYRKLIERQAETANLSPEAAKAFVNDRLDSERVAHMAEDWQGGKKVAPGVSGLLDRAVRFFGAIRNAIRGLGFQTADDVFERTFSGEQARRGAEGAQGGEQYALGATAPAAAGGFDRIPDGPIGRRIHAAVERLGIGDVIRDLQMKTAPMAARDSTIASKAAAKDFADYMRQAQWEMNKRDDLLKKEFKPEDLKAMWSAADEESVLRQQGIDTTGSGLSRLTPRQREAVEMMQDRANEVYEAAKRVGIVDEDAEGLPSYVPRMVVMAGESGFTQPTKQKGGLPLDTMGRNLTDTTPNVKHRKYLTTAETEAAAKAKFGDEAEVVRNIRTLNVATGRLQQAVAGKALINRIKQIGRDSGEPTIHEGAVPEDAPYKFFTLDHPAFKEWKPRLEKTEDGTWKAKLDEEGNPIFDKVPVYVRSDFEGPLRAVLSQSSGDVYRALMALKMNSVGLIMYSPMIHNAVEFSRALPIMPGKMLTLRVYRDGYTAKNDFDTMREFTRAGGVPIGDWRGHGGDAADIMNEPGRTADKGWLTKGLRRYVSDAAADTTGNFLHFWHQRALWDLIANLQMGLYTNLRDKMQADGIAPDIAQKTAAHQANRYAGAIPQEAMSQGARQLANLAMFSRSFTVGNLGVMKDMFMGLPSDVQAQIARDHGLEALSQIKSKAQRKAVSAFMLDTGMYYVSNSLMQNAANAYHDDEEPMADGYVRRFNSLLGQIQENPLTVLNPFYMANKLSATSDNEPGKEDRVKMGSLSDGTALYLRNPFGKIGEEFIGYATSPISMFNKKQSTILRPLLQTVSNDQGFGRKVFNPNADTPDEMLRNAGRIAWHFVAAQTPELALGGLWDLAAGRGDADSQFVNKLQTLGPLAGLTFSKGYPGGPAEGTLHREKEDFEFRFNQEKPDIRKMIKGGDLEGAQQRMTDLGVPPKSQKSFVQHTLNPGKISRTQIQNFNARATPEQRERLESSFGRASGGAIRQVLDRYAPTGYRPN